MTNDVVPILYLPLILFILDVLWVTSMAFRLIAHVPDAWLRENNRATF